MKFIRKNGRIIPLLTKGATQDAAGKGAALIGIPYAISSQLRPDASGFQPIAKINPFAIGVWGLKGAIVGEAVGALNAYRQGKQYGPKGKKQVAEVTHAFKKTLALAAAGTALKIANPFFSRNKGLKLALRLGELGAFFGSTAEAYHMAAKASDKNAGHVLAAGGAGTIAGINLLKLGKYVVKNRSKLGLRRFA